MCDSLCDLYSGLSGQGRIEAGNRSAEMFRREVGVAHHHRQRRVPKQILHLLQCRSPLDGPGRERMPQVVVVKVDQLGPSDGGLEGGTEVIPTPGAEDQPGRVDPRAAGEYGICPAVERHLAATAILGDVEQNDAPRAIHAVPGQRELFTLAQPSEEPELDEVQQVGVPRLPADIQEAVSFLGSQPPETALRFLLHSDPRHNLEEFPLVVREPQEMP